MIIKFPDGNLIDTSTQVLTPVMSSSGPALFFVLPNGSTAAYQFVFSTAVGQVTAMGEIYAGYEAGADLVELIGDAPLPTSGNSATTDMYPNNSATTPTAVSVNGGNTIYLTINRLAWPPSGGGVSSLGACFQPDASVTIGGMPVTDLKYVNGVTLKFTTPQIAAGTYDMVYTDSRGSVTKAASFIFS